MDVPGSLHSSREQAAVSSGAALLLLLLLYTLPLLLLCKQVHQYLVGAEDLFELFTHVFTHAASSIRIVCSKHRTNKHEA